MRWFPVNVHAHCWHRYERERRSTVEHGRFGGNRISYHVYNEEREYCCHCGKDREFYLMRGVM